MYVDGPEKRPTDRRALERIDLQAELIASPTLGLLASKPELQVAQLFERSANLVSKSGEYITLIRAGVDPGPFAILVQSNGHGDVSFERLLGWELQVRDIRADEHCIQINQIHLALDSAAIWNPTLVKGQLYRIQLDHALNRIVDALNRFAAADSLYHEYIASGELGVGIRIREAWSHIGQAIETADPQRCLKGAQLAAGVGIGLTPAGDDFMIGVLLALWLELNEARDYVGAIIDGAMGRTNQLSMALLRAAARGEASLAWHALTRAIIDDDPAKILTATKSVLDAGHTSGADALFGFVVASNKICRQRQTGNSPF